MTQNNHQRGLRACENGFTLVELLVVVTLSIMLMLAASAMFFMFLIGNTKTVAIQRVKSEGEFALSQMEFLLRNAVELVDNSNGDTCTQNMTDIVLVSIDNGVTTLFAEEDPTDGLMKIASNSGTYMTSAAVELTNGPEFDCVQGADGVSQYVTIQFSLRRGTPGIDQPRDIVEKTFTTGVNVRSY